MAELQSCRTGADNVLAIEQQLYRCCRAMDRMDVELGYSIWHDYGEADYGEAIFRGSGKDFVDFVTQRHAGMIAHSHQISNIPLEVRDDRADSESYVTAAFADEDWRGTEPDHQPRALPRSMVLPRRPLGDRQAALRP